MIRWWRSLDTDRKIIVGGVFLAAVILLAVLVAAFSPTCTTFPDGYEICRQNVWGGRRIWRP